MRAKAYDKKTAAFAGFLIQNVPGDLSDQDMDRWMDNPDVTKKFLDGLKLSKEVPTPELLLSAVATTTLVAIVGKPTKKCFTGSWWAYRDGDLDNWLPAGQPDAPACSVTMFALSREWTFAEAAEKIVRLRTPGASAKLLGHELINAGHTMTLAQAEVMVEATEHGEKTGLHTNGWGNFFFVETGDEADPVSVLYVSRLGRRWGADIVRLDRGNRWVAGNRLVLRNSVALTL